jgi:LysM repeat protein
MSVTVASAATGPAPAATQPAPAATVPAATWTVRPGDTLTSIAASFAVNGGWQALYAANRAAVGPDPDLVRPGTILTLPGKAQPLKYVVAQGDTLASIAAAMSVTGGWRALYAANRRAVGSDPDLIRPGTGLVDPGHAATATPRQAPAPGSGNGQPTAPAASGSGNGQPTAPAASGSGSAQPASSAAGRTQPARPAATGQASSGGTARAGIMPGWLKTTLLAAALLTLIAFLVEPAVMASRRRKRTGGRTAPATAAAGTCDGACQGGHSPAEHRAAGRKPRVIQADYERLVIGYTASDDTVFLLTPPGEDPRAILRAARLVLPEDTYEEVASHLGVPSGWRE